MKDYQAAFQAKREQLLQALSLIHILGEVSILDGRGEHALLLHMLGQRSSGTTITG